MPYPTSKMRGMHIHMDKINISYLGILILSNSFGCISVGKQAYTMDGRVFVPANSIRCFRAMNLSSEDLTLPKGAQLKNEVSKEYTCNWNQHGSLETVFIILFSARQKPCFPWNCSLGH